MPNLIYTDSPSIYPAGMLSAYVDTPPEGVSVKITAAHHVEALERQRLCYRGYPLTQATTCGEISTASQYGLFQAPPNAESVTVFFLVKAGAITTDRTFTVIYNSQTKTASVDGSTASEGGNPYPGYLKFKLGPWPLASPGGDTVTDLVFETSCTVTTEVFGLSAEFSKKSA